MLDSHATDTPLLLRPICALMLAFLVGACGKTNPSPKPPTAEAARAAVLEILEEERQAWNRGDLKQFCASYAEDALYLSPSGVTIGRDKVLQRYDAKYRKGGAEMGILAFDIKETRVSPMQDAVSVALGWKLEWKNKPPAEGLALVLFHWRDGRWQIVQDASM